MMILPTSRLRFAVVMLFATFAVMANPEMGMLVPFHARVDFNDAGTPVIGAIEGLPATSEIAVRKELAKMTIHPGTLAAHTAFHATLSGNAELILDGDMVTATVRDASFFPLRVSNGKASAVIYPANRIRRGEEGIVELFLRIATDGRVIEATPVRSTHRDFEQSAMHAVRNWQYDPKTLAAETSGLVQIRFHLHGGALETSEADCPLDRSKPYIEGQSGCLSVMEVTGSLIRIRS